MERRLAAILAADVIGHSRLMAADEAGTLAALTALRREFVEPLRCRAGRRPGSVRTRPSPAPSFVNGVFIKSR